MEKVRIDTFQNILGDTSDSDEIKYVTVQIPIQTARFIEFIEQTVSWGEVTVIVKNGIPVRAKIIMKEVKF